MDGYEHLDLDETDFAPVEYATQRLPLLTPGEAHAVLGVLLAVVGEGGPVASDADRLAREIAARIPSQN